MSRKKLILRIKQADGHPTNKDRNQAFVTPNIIKEMKF